MRLEGNWIASQGSKQSHELQTAAVTVLGDNDAESSPLQSKYQTPEYLRTIPHLRPRIPTNALLLRLRSQVIASITRFFNDEGFVQTHTPIITSSDCEGAGEVFTVSSNSSKVSEHRGSQEGDPHAGHFFRTPKYLTVSAQLHLEALAQAVNKVWTLSPTFRAEKSDTARHLSEFYMLEAEQCFVTDLKELLSLVERMLRAVAVDLKQSKVGQEILQARQASSEEDSDGDGRTVSAVRLQQRWDGMAMTDWPRMKYKDAVETLQKYNFEVRYEDGLETEHERALADLDQEKRPVFVTDYPREQKPFYMRASPESAGVTGDTVSCFDLLVPDLCELIGGSMREHRSKELWQSMQEKGVASTNLEWYQDLRKYGSVPHGGFGLGFDRLLCYLSGVGNIKDIVAFPRWNGRCDC